MQNPALYAAAMRVAKTAAETQAGERVCITTDTNKLPLAEVFAAVCAVLNAQPVVAVMSPASAHGQEPPRIIAAAMRAADVVIQPVTYAITHTDATKAALEAGARVLVLRGVTEEILTGGAAGADYDDIDRLTQAVAARLSEAASVRVTSPSGTDLTIQVAGRRALALSGKLHGPGSLAAMPDGEAAISPVEGTGEGVIVFEHTMDNLGFLDAPITVDIREGRAVHITGGRSAAQLRAVIDEAGDGARNLAEFAIGTNPAARLIGNMAEDKKKLGTVHFALGDNHVIGGTITSTIHLDGLVLRPTAVLDGEVLVEDGAIVRPGD